MIGELALGKLVLANLHWVKDHRPDKYSQPISKTYQELVKEDLLK